MNKIILDCSEPEKGCKSCIFMAPNYGCVAPIGLADCLEHHGVWVVDWENDGNAMPDTRERSKK